jgi:hypothetical protein
MYAAGLGATPFVKTIEAIGTKANLPTITPYIETVNRIATPLHVPAPTEATILPVPPPTGTPVVTTGTPAPMPVLLAPAPAPSGSADTGGYGLAASLAGGGLSPVVLIGLLVVGLWAIGRAGGSRKV